MWDIATHIIVTAPGDWLASLNVDNVGYAWVVTPQAHQHIMIFLEHPRQPMISRVQLASASAARAGSATVGHTHTHGDSALVCYNPPLVASTLTPCPQPFPSSSSFLRRQTAFVSSSFHRCYVLHLSSVYLPRRSSSFLSVPPSILLLSQPFFFSNISAFGRHTPSTLGISLR